MVKPRTLPRAVIGFAGLRGRLLPLLAFYALLTLAARAALQFDVFLGYDGVVPEAAWFPAVCEVKNDGPSFTGVIEISSGRFNESQTRRLVVELPTGTLKRVLIPVFSTARYQSTWDIRLLDERGKVRAQQLNVPPKKQIASATTLIGALPRTANGVPVIRPILSREGLIQPASARLQASLLPDNPLVFEGMDTLYLNSEKASELSVNQVNALLAWLNNGGHLIIAVEQITDVNATGWLRTLVPCELTGLRALTSHGELQDWLRAAPALADEGAAGRNRLAGKAGTPGANPFNDLAADPEFEKAEVQVVTGKSHGEALVTAGGAPLLLRSQQGRGRVTTLLFSPEREPFRSWKNLPSFWAKLAQVPPELYVIENNKNNNILRGGWSIDGVFGAMIDSKQVRKLPVEWLLLLLIVYLVVIGPLDQYWLKRINRPMLTWITFPCYVVLFSLLIYFIGYKLRAGETEWNELHLVDILAHGEGAELRGRTYASIYSPVNAGYRVESSQQFSTFRGEFQSSWSGGGQENERAEILQNGDGFKAEIFVPVWTSQLFVSDWWQPAALPLNVTVVPGDSDWLVTVNNRLERSLTNAHLVVAGRIMELGGLPAGGSKTFTITPGQGTSLAEFVRRHGADFQKASQQRQQAFGASGGGKIEDVSDAVIAASFFSQLDQERFISAPGLDLSRLLEQGNAVLLAWEPDYSPVRALNQFATRRGHKDTLWRVVVPLDAPNPP